VIPIQILRVLSTIQQYGVPALLMGGQACVLYGAAEYSRDLDLAVLATDDGLPKLSAAIEALHAHVIAVPPFEAQYLRRGHAVHFSVPDVGSPTVGATLRVDVMSRMRGVESFDELWARRTTVVLPDPERATEVTVEMMALEDLVAAKKTQRDKDWPMLRRLVDASYDSARDSEASAEQANFWLAELRSPEFLREAIERFPRLAARSPRAAVACSLTGGDVADALAREQATEMAADRVYWEPLRRELEALRHAARRA
jgi:hypothetical protein